MTDLEEAVGKAVGVPVLVIAPAGGGAINRAAKATLSDGSSAFVKHRAGAPSGTFVVEADGLRWLADAGALRVPAVLGVWDDTEPRALVLEWIERGRPASDHDERLGRGLAALHAGGADGFGYPLDNLIGPLPQANPIAPDWASFYGQNRILAMARIAIDAGRLPISFAERAERLAARLPQLLGPAEPPARLHGDLWAGNAIVDSAGAPVLVDPAVYGGHREVDLAMMRLFGGFSERVFAAYEEVAPLSAGAAERVRLLQLYPLLVHVVLFGGAYRNAVERSIAAYE